MKYRWVSRRLHGYSKDGLRAVERLGVWFHLNRCDCCFEQYDEIENAASSLRQQASVTPQSQLGTSIRMAISRGTARENWWVVTFRKWRMAARELMRPVPIRGLGGALPAAVLFAMSMPQIVVERQQFPDDIPLAYLAQSFVSHPTIAAPSPYAVSSRVAVVANALLFAAFEPAMEFGQPIAGKVLIRFASQRYTVRG